MSIITRMYKSDDKNNVVSYADIHIVFKHLTEHCKHFLMEEQHALNFKINTKLILLELGTTFLNIF